ncbi:MAG TPA: hypothetical protein PLL32_00715 [Anaeromyxobacteraceae bacterium]|nr:hypothetical protein [Anaeromyxobacteraceae bacterium]
MRILPALAASLLLAGPARADGIAVSFDPELAPPGGQQAFEAQLREVVRDARARVVAGLGMEPDPRVSVQVHSRAGFERRFGAEAARIDRARFEGDVIHVNGDARLDDRIAATVVHELCHAALDARGTARRLPRWLDEGLCERLSWQRRGVARPAADQVAELRQARERRQLLPLPADGELSRTGYLASWSAVVWLEGKVGRDRLLAAVRATLAGEPFEAAARRELGMGQEDVDRGFDAWVGGL